MDAETHCRSMTHLFDNLFHRANALFGQLEHYRERVLDQRSAGGSIQIGALFLLPQMGRVIRCDHVHQAIGDTLSQGLTVFGALYRRVPFDPIPFGRVIGVAEPQVVYAHLVRNLLFGEGFFLEQRELPSRTQV